MSFVAWRPIIIPQAYKQFDVDPYRPFGAGNHSKVSRTQRAGHLIPFNAFNCLSNVSPLNSLVVTFSSDVRDLNHLLGATLYLIRNGHYFIEHEDKLELMGTKRSMAIEQQAMV